MGLSRRQVPAQAVAEMWGKSSAIPFRRIGILLLAATVTGSTVTACSKSEPTQIATSTTAADESVGSEQAASAEAFAETIGEAGGWDGDFTPPVSPLAALDSSETGMLVSLTDIREGRDVYGTPESVGAGGPPVFSTYLVEARLVESIRGTVPRQFVLEMIMPAGTSIDELRATFPVGTSALALTDDYTKPDAPTTPVNTEPGLTYLAPGPLGLLLSGTDGRVVAPLTEGLQEFGVGWEVESFDSLLEQMRESAGTATVPPESPRR